MESEERREIASHPPKKQSEGRLLAKSETPVSGHFAGKVIGTF
jgi:hypothetical protein